MNLPEHEEVLPITTLLWNDQHKTLNLPPRTAVSGFSDMADAEDVVGDSKDTP